MTSTVIDAEMLTGVRYCPVWQDPAMCDKVLDAAAVLVAAHGLAEVTFDDVAHAASMSRARLAKLYRDLPAVLDAWAARTVDRYLVELAALHDGPGDPAVKLEMALEAYAKLAFEQYATELAVLLRRSQHFTRARSSVALLIEQMIHAGGRAGVLRIDKPARELATESIETLAAMTSMPSEDAAKRLVVSILRRLRRRR